MEICFVADNNYKRFLKDYKPEKISSIGKGSIVDEEGQKIGEHSGYTNYTVGQRKGLGLSNPEPRYVSKIDPINNQITIGKKNSLKQNICHVSKLNWLIENIELPLIIFAQIRYNSIPVEATLNKQGNSYSVNFNEPQLAITPGQSIVFYDKDIVIGGGIIERT